MSELIGKTLGPYRIIEQIGIGGMATVYKAYQPSMDRYVAIKVLPAIVSRDPAFLKRFRREAKVVAKLEHKHILPVHDYGEQEGFTYLVMRYVEAGTLKEQLAAGQLDLPEIYRIIAQVGAALDYAHRLGVIHRDVKPTNVLIDSQGDAYLTDFGLARIMESSEQLTATGVGVGTPAYMAPEQGQGLKIDHRSDIYSLGVMLYEMVTGRVPYEAETPMAVVIKHITDPLPLPSSVKPDIPPQVERVILKAMAKDPDDRFQTVAEMVTALDAAVRLAQAEAPAVVGELAAAKEAAPPSKGPLARVVAGVREATQTGWGRTAMWAAVGIVALLAFFLVLSRVPLKVQIRGGQLEVVRVVEATPALSEAEGATPEAAAPTTTPVLSRSPEQSEGAAEGPTEAVAAKATAMPKSVSTATLMPTRTPGPTATPQLTATPTPNPMAEQARAFAEPILAAVASREPTWSDDFSDPGSGWPIQETDWMSWGYEDGVYFIMSGIEEHHPTIRPDHVPSFSDFVLELDGRTTSGQAGSWFVLFRASSSSHYAVAMQPGGALGMHRHDSDGTDASFVTSFCRPAIRPGYEANHLQIIVQGPRMAVYVNGEPLWFVSDESLSQGRIGLMTYTSTDIPHRVEFDNLKIWDISDLALPSAEATPAPQPTATPTPHPSVAEQVRAFAEPILAAIAEHPPDYADDFSDPGSGWSLRQSTEGETGYEDGEYVAVAAPGYTSGGESSLLPEFSDFVLEIDARFVSGDDGNWGLTLRRRWENQTVGYGVMFRFSGEVEINRRGVGEKRWTTLTSIRKPFIRPGYETNHLQIIAKGAQIALAVNGEWATLVTDPGYTTQLEEGTIRLDAGNDGGGAPLRVQWDNLKIWDISDLALP